MAKGQITTRLINSPKINPAGSIPFLRCYTTRAAISTARIRRPSRVSLLGGSIACTARILCSMNFLDLPVIRPRFDFGPLEQTVAAFLLLMSILANSGGHEATCPKLAARSYTQRSKTSSVVRVSTWWP